MPHTPDHARRLLRELEAHLPEAANRVLERERYHDPGFCDRFLAYTEELIFRQPTAGLRVARLTPRLVHIITVNEGASQRQDNMARLVKALGLVGAGYRAVGALAEAEQEYRTALRICERERLSPLHRIDLYLRWATLRNRQQRFGQALRFIDEATVISEAESDENWLAVALATRGVTYGAAGRLREAVATLSKVLANRRLTPQVELSATTNLARAILELDDPERLDEALIHLRNARRLLGPRQSVQKSRLYWIEGTACIRRGRTDDGERRYRKALAGFRKFCAVYEHALVALDISALLRFAGRWSELEGLAAETFARFQDMSEDAEALAALRLWLEASRERELNEALLSNVKATLEQRSRCNTPSGVARRLGS